MARKKFVNPVCPHCNLPVVGDGVLIAHVKVAEPLTQEKYDKQGMYDNGRVGHSVFEFTATAQNYRRKVYHPECV